MGIMTAAVFTVCCCVSAGLFVRAYRDQDYVRGFWLKGAAALFFVATGVALLVEHGGNRFAVLTVLGLVLGLAGDQLLALRLIHMNYHDLFFTIGALSFAAGHVLYILALRLICTLNVAVILLVFVLGALLSFWYAKKTGIDVGEKTPFAVAYIAVVLLMASVAICAAIRSSSVCGWLFAVGGILFSVSDNILCAYSFGRNPIWKMNRDLHIAYYGAQIAIAWSILFS